MKRSISIEILSIAAVSAFLINAPLFAADTKVKAPRVAYTAPADESTVDLTGKKTLKFEWKSQPIPGGGRRSYKLTVYKGFGYDTVVNETIDPKTFSIDIPVEIFEDGATYSWNVKQRDADGGQWSMCDSWSFKAIKK